MDISRAAFDLIVAEEISSKATYESRYRHTEWPGASSGVTIGIGYDVGYSTPARLFADWNGKIPDTMISALSKACGVTGERAKPLAASLKSQIDIPWAAAIDVFENTDVPRWVATVRKALPNTQLLPPDCLGALVSLAYNRGPSFGTAGERYREMRAIKTHMTTIAFEKIPVEFRAMKRLWPELKGLRDRREREAKLFERGLANDQSTDIPAVLADTAGPKPVVIKGPDMTKDQILKLQKDLNTLGATPPLVVDGISGGQTRNAVVSFQKLAGLVADGIAGPRTLAAIDARLAGGTPPTPIVVSREIHVVAQHGLFGGWPVGLSMGIDAVIAKGQKEGLRITSTILEHYQDSAALAAAIAAYKRKAIVVLTGHSLGAGDAVESSNAMVRAGTPPTLLFVFDPTWNSPAPPVEGPVRAIDIYGTAASPLGHDKLEAAPGFTGKIINVGRQVDHVVVDDDLVGHSLFLGELRFLAGRTDKLPVYPVT